MTRRESQVRKYIWLKVIFSIFPFSGPIAIISPTRIGLLNTKPSPRKRLVKIFCAAKARIPPITPAEIKIPFPTSFTTGKFNNISERAMNIMIKANIFLSMYARVINVPRFLA